MVVSNPASGGRATGGAAHARTLWRLAPFAACHLAALALLLATEFYQFPAVAGFVLAWGFLNFAWLVLLRRPTVAALLSLAMIAILIEVSKYKYSIVVQTVNFTDVLIMDPATVSFLLAMFPGYRLHIAGAIALLALTIVALWRFDRMRLSRRLAAAGAGGCLGGLVLLSFSHPFEYNWFIYGHVSNFARSAVDAVSEFARKGFMEADTAVADHLRATAAPCDPGERPPHIILVHDESAFDVRRAPGVKVLEGYGEHFRSFDGKQRDLLVEVVGGGSWYAEFNVLTGLSTRSFGRFDFFVTRIAAGRIKRGLPSALRRCGYRTFSLYPYRGAFLSAKSFHTTAGVQGFYDMDAMQAREFEPDRFYYDAARRLIARERAAGPVFAYVYLSALHGPYDTPWMPELTPEWQAPGNDAAVDEYLRRQTLGMRHYREFLEALKRDFPGEPFLVVRYGDHQPYLAQKIIEPGLSDDELARRVGAYDPRYYTTYYAIDTVNFSPANVASALDTIEVAHLPLVALEAAGVPLDPSFAEQKKILERCRGLFYQCGGGAEARRFNRLLIDAGMIHGM
jgi:hypothetical protein